MLIKHITLKICTKVKGLLKYVYIIISAYVILGFSPEEFTWSSYLKLSKAASAPKNLFVNNATATVSPIFCVCRSTVLHLLHYLRTNNLGKGNHNHHPLT